MFRTIIFRSLLATPALIILNVQAQAFQVPSWSEIQKLKGNEKLNRAKKILNDAEASIPDNLTNSKDIEKAQLIYFLDAHLERLSGAQVKCNSVPKVLAQAKEVSVTRESKPESLSKSYSDELQKMLNAICEK